MSNIINHVVVGVVHNILSFLVLAKLYEIVIVENIT